ncbi:MAG: hypothetical protein ABSE16_01625 [Verrucomicrobiota bacterium]|jgi:tetratricopeptide (TPR) repeat protein
MFGSILIIFLIAVFIWSPKELPAYKRQLLGIFNAVLSGLFGYFFTGSIKLVSEQTLAHCGKIRIQAGGGIALFLLTLWWWNSALAPVQRSPKSENSNRDVIGNIAVGNGNVQTTIKNTLTLTDDQFSELKQTIVESMRASQGQDEFGPVMDYQVPLRKWAAEMNITPEQAQGQVEAWIEDIRNRKYVAQETLAVADFLAKNYEESGIRYSHIATNLCAELAELKYQENHVRTNEDFLALSIATNYSNAGDSFVSAQKLPEAVACYSNALTFVRKADSPILWADTAVALGLTHQQFNLLKTPDASLQHLRYAIEYFEPAIEIYGANHERLEKAITQSHLGFALSQLANLGDLASRQALITQAITLFDEASEACPLTQSPEKWAEIRLNADNVLLDRVEYVGVRQGAEVITNIIEDYRKMLGIYNRGKNPEEWGVVQLDFGNALRRQASMGFGTESATLLADSVAHYKAALSIFTPAKSQLVSAMGQLDLGLALAAEAQGAVGKERQALFTNALNCYKEVGNLCSSNSFPQLWAMLQMDVGDLLSDQAEGGTIRNKRKLAASAEDCFNSALTIFTMTNSQVPSLIAQIALNNCYCFEAQYSDNAEKQRLLERAVNNYRELLEVVTKDKSTNGWALLESGLGDALSLQADEFDGGNRSSIEAEAEACYHAALEVCSQQEDPKTWATIQESLGDLREHQAEGTTLEEAATSLEQAVTHYRNALRVLDRDKYTDKWAAAHLNLGSALNTFATTRGHEEEIRLLEEATAASEQAERVFTRTDWPREWADLQVNLGISAYQRALLSERREATLYLSNAVSSYRNGLTIITTDDSPEDLANAEVKLGFALSKAADASSGEQETELLKAAEIAFTNALLIYTPFQPTQERWAETQLALADTLRTHFMVCLPPERSTYVQEAMSRYISILTNAQMVMTNRSGGYTSAYAAVFENTMYSMGNMFLILGQLGQLDHQRGLFSAATDDFRWLVYLTSRENEPEASAHAQYCLGLCLMLQAAGTTNNDNAEVLKQAASAFRGSLKYYSRDNVPRMASKAEQMLGLALLTQSKVVSGPYGQYLAIEAAEAFQQAQSVATESTDASLDWTAF